MAAPFPFHTAQRENTLAASASGCAEGILAVAGAVEARLRPSTLSHVLEIYLRSLIYLKYFKPQNLHLQCEQK